MIRHSVAVLAWLFTVSMTAARVWVIAQGDFMNLMMGAPAEQSRITM